VGKNDWARTCKLLIAEIAVACGKESNEKEQDTLKEMIKFRTRKYSGLIRLLNEGFEKCRPGSLGLKWNLYQW
jgi:hypothetical protein